MKLSHKLVMVSAAALMAVAPIAEVSSSNIAQAATSKKSTKATKTSKKTAKKAAKNTNTGNTITLGHNAYVYFANGKRNKNYSYNGKKYPKLAKGSTLKSAGTVTINGKAYYDIGAGSYVKAANVSKVNGKKAPKVKADSDNELKALTLTHNAYVYDKKGKHNKSVKTLKKGAILTYTGTKKIKGKKYYNLGNGQYIKAANAKVASDESSSEATTEFTYIKLVKNSIIYNDQGEVPSDSVKLSRGAQYIAQAAKEIDGKWYYKIGTTEVGDQWIRAVNAVVVSGPKLITDPSFKEPSDNTATDTTNGTVVTLKNAAQVYDGKGQMVVNNVFAKGKSLRVSSLIWIWVPAEKSAVEFYKIDSASDSYIKASDVATISGASLTATNTQQEAQEAGTIASSTDKQGLNAAISEANTVKVSDAYKLASSQAKNAYDTAISKGQTVNSSSTASVLDVKNALAAINKAKAALNGAKVSVKDRNNLTEADQAAIIQAVANAYGVSTSAVSFANNNTSQLTITGSNGAVTTVNTADYLN